MLFPFGTHLRFGTFSRFSSFSLLKTVDELSDSCSWVEVCFGRQIKKSFQVLFPSFCRPLFLVFFLLFVLLFLLLSFAFLMFFCLKILSSFFLGKTSGRSSGKTFRLSQWRGNKSSCHLLPSFQDSWLAMARTVGARAQRHLASSFSLKSRCRHPETGQDWVEAIMRQGSSFHLCCDALPVFCFFFVLFF